MVSDKEIFENYCSHIKVPKEDYIQFLKDSRENNPYENYGENKNYFSMYVSDFEQSSEYKNAQKQDEKQKTNLNTIKAFYNYVLEIEKDKVYYFALVYNQNVLVVTSPSDNAEQEKFLGYTWSNRKGDEGIKLKEDSKIKCGVLYNTNDEENSLACYVKDSFLGIYRNEGSLQKYLNSFSLSDMLDFTRTTFDKAIRTNVQSEKAKIESKYPLVKLGEVAEIKKGKSITSAEVKQGSVKVVAGGIDFAYLHNEANRPENIITVSASGANAGFVNFWKEPIFASDCTTIIANDLLITKYIYNILKTYQQYIFKLQKGQAQPHVYADDLKLFSIPNPPLDIQQNIVDECETVDSEYEESQNTISRCKNEIAEIMKNVKGEEKKLNEICEMKAGKFVSANEIYDEQLEDSFPCFGGNGLRGYTKDFTHDGVYPLIGRQGALCGNVCLATGKFHATEHAVAVTPKEGINVYWLRYKLEHMNLNQYATGTAQPGLSVNKILEVSCSVPPLAEQQKIVEQITVLEEQIASAKKIIADVPARKQAILDKWL